MAIYAHWAAAVLCNGLARYQEGVSAALQVSSTTFEYWVSVWVLPELVEAAAREGDAELARGQLLYGEWLRREGRRLDARQQLRTAHDLFTAIAMEAFAERTRRELAATGEQARKRRPETRQALTAQETQIARLARDGLSNPEIGGQLFLSARTVEWHLRKVFTKLDISSRRQLRVALPEGGQPLAS